MRTHLRLLLLAFLLGLTACAWRKPPSVVYMERNLRDAHLPEKRAEAALELADSLMETEYSRRKRARALKLYRQVIAEEVEEFSLRATNNLGAALLANGKAREALPLLAGIKTRMDDPEYHAGKPRYLYNLALALEAGGRREEALDHFLEAISLESDLEKAAAAAFRVSHNLPSAAAGLSGATRLVRELREDGNLPSAHLYLRRALADSQWLEETGYEQLLREAAFVIAASEANPSELELLWRSLQTDLPKLIPASRQRVEELTAAYQGELPLSLDPEEARRSVHGWTGSKEDLQAFAAALFAIGKGQLSAERPEAASRSFALAWSLGGDPEAAVHLAAILRELHERVDPTRSILMELVRRAPKPTRSGENESLLRLHVILGDALREANKPENSIAQWQQALNLSPDLPSPVLLAGLAEAYEAAGEGARACAEYLRAAERLRDIGYYEAARKMALRIPERCPFFPDQEPRYNSLLNELTELAPITPPIIKPTVSVRSELLSESLQVLFATGKADLSAEARDTLDKLINDVWASGKEVEIWIEGHTDAVGPEKYNNVLGLRRASAVWTYLLEHDVPDPQIHQPWLRSFGKEGADQSAKPPNGIPEDRKVVIRIVTH